MQPREITLQRLRVLDGEADPSTLPLPDGRHWTPDNGGEGGQRAPADRLVDRLIDGATFVLDAPDTVPAVWGEDDDVLWAQGEALIVVGPAGVGKSTIEGQLVAGRLGLLPEVLGMPVAAGQRRTLVLASDRPQQIARAFRRLFTPEHHDVLADRLRVWKGPPPGDLAQNTGLLLDLCHQADADTVFLDSLKDMAVGLSDDAVGAGLNIAVQRVLAAGIEVVGLHHQRKPQGSEKPKDLASVYGSTWITAGAGSVVLLWGAPGDALVQLEHLKQPAAVVGPWTIEHDHHAGTSAISKGFELLRYLRLHPKGVTVREVTVAATEKANPTEADRRRWNRKLDGLVARGLAHKQEPQFGGARDGQKGSTGAKFFAVDNAIERLVGSPDTSPDTGLS